MTRVISILVKQNEGKFNEKLKFQNAVSLQLLTDEGKISYMSHPKETKEACKILLESERAMKMLPLKCVCLKWNGPVLFGSG
jgi:hypothetical protein